LSQSIFVILAVVDGRDVEGALWGFIIFAAIPFFIMKKIGNANDERKKEMRERLSRKQKEKYGSDDSSY